LVGTLARVILGSAVQGPLVDVHPLAVIGWLGLVITVELDASWAAGWGQLFRQFTDAKQLGEQLATLIVHSRL